MEVCYQHIEQNQWRLVFDAKSKPYNNLTPVTSVICETKARYCSFIFPFFAQEHIYESHSYTENLLFLFLVCSLFSCQSHLNDNDCVGLTLTSEPHPCVKIVHRENTIYFSLNTHMLKKIICKFSRDFKTFFF